MPYELKLNRFEGKKEGWKYRRILITDVMLHANKYRPSSPARALDTAFKKNESGRIYSKLNKPDGSSKAMVIEILKSDPEFVNYIREQEAQGYKVLMEFPKEGVPVLLGPDTVDFMESVKGKRILRRLAKKIGQE